MDNTQPKPPDPRVPLPRRSSRRVRGYTLAPAEEVFAGVPASAAAARTWLHEQLHGSGTDDEAAHAAAVVLSELCSNAVRHSQSGGPDGSFHVRLRFGAAQLRLEVTDAGGHSEPDAADPNPYAESGRGLALVESLSSRWWVTGDRRSRTVAAELPSRAGHTAS